MLSTAMSISAIVQCRMVKATMRAIKCSETVKTHLVHHGYVSGRGMAEFVTGLAVLGQRLQARGLSLQSFVCLGKHSCDPLLPWATRPSAKSSCSNFFATYHNESHRCRKMRGKTEAQIHMQPQSNTLSDGGSSPRSHPLLESIQTLSGRLTPSRLHGRSTNFMPRLPQCSL